MRLPRLISLPLLTAGLWMSLGLARNVERPLCLMMPAYPEMRLPTRGFITLHDEAPGSKCNDVPATNWMRAHAGTIDIYVHADGPSGSGRYWAVTVGVGDPKQGNPIRGVCFTTTTGGWRTLQRFKDAPLPWLEDLDHDGKAELIIWDSFALHQDATMAELGLVAWVYRLRPDNSLMIDWELSRQMAREIADAYRLPLDSKDQVLAQLRAQATQALEQFANQQCSTQVNDSH